MSSSQPSCDGSFPTCEFSPPTLTNPTTLQRPEKKQRRNRNQKIRKHKKDHYKERTQKSRITILRPNKKLRIKWGKAGWYTCSVESVCHAADQQSCTVVVNGKDQGELFQSDPIILYSSKKKKPEWNVATKSAAFPDPPSNFSCM